MQQSTKASVIRGSLCLCSKPAPQTDALNATSGTDVDTGCSTQSGCAPICILSHRQGKEKEGKVKLLQCPWVFTERGRSWQQTVDDVIVQGPGESESKSKASKPQSRKASCRQCRAGRRQVDGRYTILHYTTYVPSSSCTSRQDLPAPLRQTCLGQTSR
jgi:hypothetical protein